MPFTKHTIEPINITRCPIPDHERNELECLSNLTLANVIRQLSSLGEHADLVFSELLQESEHIGLRTRNLVNRIDKLAAKISQLDIQNEEVSINDFQTKKQFKSSNQIDQQVLSRKTMPEAMEILYNLADPPPALDKLNMFRDDGKDCMKFYTDPDFFFNLWRNEMMKENEGVTGRKGEKGRRKKSKNGKNDMQKPVIEPTATPLANTNKQRELQQQQLQMAHMMQAANVGNRSPYTNQDHYNYQMDNGRAAPQQQPQQYRQQQPPVYNQQSNNNNMYGTIFDSNQMSAPSTASSSQVSSRKPSEEPQRFQRPSLSPTERPIVPPPPPPILTSPTRHQKVDMTSSVNGGFDFRDLPPPPSPPVEHHNDVDEINSRLQRNLSMTPPPPHLLLSPTSNGNHLSGGNCHVDSSDLPLPPPPIDFVEDIMQEKALQHTSGTVRPTNNSVPPPPPPPLAPNLTSQQSQSPINEMQQARNSLLDDIRRGQHNLRKLELEEYDKKQKEANLSGFNVADILDAINERRRHIEQSEDDDSDNSEWDA